MAGDHFSSFNNFGDASGPPVVNVDCRRLNQRPRQKKMPTSLSILEPDFTERWFAGTYVVSGTFFQDGTNAEPEDLMSWTKELYSTVRANQKAPWPRGLAGYFIIPVICSDRLSRRLEEWARSRHRYRWAIWLEPILYNTRENTIIMRADYGFYGRAFYPYLGTLFTKAVVRAGSHFGHQAPPEIK